MLRVFTGLMLFLAVAGLTTSATAGDDEGFWHNVHLGWHRNNEWPEPFISADRGYAVAPFAAMIANGWQRQNLIGENYFDEGSKRLNNPGIERIRYILRQAPVEHRVLFVQRDLRDEVTNARIDLVQEAVASLQPKGPLPEVVASNMVVEGRSAELVTAELDGYRKSPPTPRLSGHASGGGGASSGAPPPSGSGSN
jgi:hypothetical protein